MSTDENVTKDILETLEDGRDGYEKGAEKLDGLEQPTLVATFRELSAQRKAFGDELQGMAKAYGDDPDRSGSIAATLHRGWMSLKDALSKDDAKAILEVAHQGDDHAVTEYDKALGEDISVGLREVLVRQRTDISAARDKVAALAASHQG